MSIPTRVLIVDDKEENLYYLTALLNGNGCVVQAAHHGAEALVKARQAPPDLIVSDLLMPVMDGYTLLRHWKADPRLKGVPFVVYTATYTEADDERLALNLGADAFILKPAEPEEFLARLREVQANAAAAIPALPRTPIGDEKALLKVYSETLIRKLEEKTLQLEESNRALQEDIARRKEMEERLRESEERFRATFEQAAVGIAHIGTDGTLLRVNDKFCEITGYPRVELLQLDLPRLTIPEDRAAGDDMRQGMLSGRQESYTSEKRYRKKGGDIFWGNLVITLLRDGTGQPKYFIAVISDVTAEKILQEQFLRAQRLESIGTLAGGIAHDLNNLLTPVLMGADLLKLGRQDAGSLRVIDTIERSAKRGTELLKQVLSFARGMAGERVPVNLSHVVREIAAMVTNTFPKNIEFISEIPKEAWPVKGDPTQLNQILLNLCVNARDAMPAGGRLTIRASNTVIDAQYAAMNPGATPGRHVLVEVLDSGVGMPKEVMDRIFEPFFTTKEIGKGTGLGLSTVVGIVRSHGGFLRVHSEPGEGSTFSIYLPTPGDDAVSSGSSQVTAPPRRGQGECVLVVDDEPAIVAVTRQTLEHHGYRVLTAENGAEAVGLFAAHRTEIAAILTDMMMPVMDGTALIAALQRIDPTVRIVAASGTDSRADIQQSSIPGVSYMLAKPYMADGLLRVIGEVVTEPRKATVPSKST